MESPSLPKRAKAPSNFPQIAHCLVDGCNADLSVCRDYHRRHKVCEIHSKTPRVQIRGQEQRFCQQCSRFHSLDEFDDGKRSCRKRLDGHNRRRRKQQPESMARTMNQPSSLPGPSLISFGSSQLMPMSITPSTWPGLGQYEHQVTSNETMEPFPSFSSHSFMGLNQDHHNFSMASTVPDVQFFPESQNHQVVFSDGALSLLSTAPQPQASKASSPFTLTDADFNEPVPAAQSISGGFNYDNNSGLFHRDTKPRDSSAQYHGDGTTHFQELFHHSGEGSSSGGSRQTLSFLWE